MFERPFFESMEPEEEGEITIQVDQGDTGAGTQVEEGTDEQ